MKAWWKDPNVRRRFRSGKMAVEASSGSDRYVGYLTLGVVEIAVTPMESVQTSRRFSRDPRVRWPDEVLMLQAMQSPFIRAAAAGMLWCSVCGEERPRDYFNHDVTRKARGGYSYRCRQCENAWRRRMYQQTKSA